MTNPMWSNDSARGIAVRIVVTGDLVLETPAHFGNGNSDESVIALQTDSIEPSRPLLPGPSIAGALRAYLRQVEYGYGIKERTDMGSSHRRQESFLTASLFGAPNGGLSDKYGEQSRLLVDDSIGAVGAATDYRDGVRINGASRAAQDGGLYTFQVWSAGTMFPLRFELLIPEVDMNREANLRAALATALDGLAKGEISLGARKKRGLGRGRVSAWSVTEYDMHNPQHLMEWLKGTDSGGSKRDGNAFSALGAQNLLEDRRHVFRIKARFIVEGSLLIRTAGNESSDMPHLKSNGKSVLSGTSVAGAIRARAQKIVNTLGVGTTLIEDMFGRLGDKSDARGLHEVSASRVIIRESELQGGTAELVQSRVSIDRFTGGALDTALFNEAPHWGGQIEIELELRNPDTHEIGLLLLVLKDLWTGDLPLGGESSVGRGRLRGISAELILRRSNTEGELRTWTWLLSETDLGLKVDGDATDWLETCVGNLGRGGAA